MSENPKPPLRFETLQLHAGERPGPGSGVHSPPASPPPPSGLAAALRCALPGVPGEHGDTGTRTADPALGVFEQRMAALEGGAAAVVAPSERAARFLALTTLAEAGDNVVFTRRLSAGTVQQLDAALPRLGIEARFAQGETPEAFEARIDRHTRAVYLETLGGPLFNVPDFEGLAAVAHRGGVPLVVDNSSGAAGYLCRPIDHGADIVLASARGWIGRWDGGHGMPTAGAVVDGGRFEWEGGRFPGFAEAPSEARGPDPHRRLLPKAPPANLDFLHRARRQGGRVFGPALCPFDSRSVLAELETLSLRVQRQVDSALELAWWLEEQPWVRWVSYPGLPDHPHHLLARRYLRRGFGALLSFGVRGGAKAGLELAGAVELAGRRHGLGEARRSVILPAGSGPSPLGPEVPAAGEGAPGGVLVSVGLEHVDDLKADFRQALSTLRRQLP